MQIPQYIDIAKIFEDFVIVYTRVSSTRQDTQKQVPHAKAYIHNHNIDENKVIWLDDHDISANKLKTEDRAGLMELRLLIKQKKVKKIIVYSRDRLARNFYEYVALVKEFYYYGVEIIFTGQMQPPFSKNLSIEALYGIFAQTEGRSITGRRGDTQKQFPSKIFGYEKIGNKKNTHYAPDNAVQDELKSFLLAMREVNNVDDFFTVLMKYTKVMKRRNYVNLLDHLQNPFYAGHMETLYGYEKLNHVEPLITLDDFNANQLVLKRLKNDINNTITNTSSRGIIVPHCSICNKEMTFRSSELGQNGYYVCRKKHKPIKITVDLFNELINSHLKSILESLSAEKLKADSFAYFKKIESEIEHKTTVLNRQLKKIHEEMTENYITSTSFSKIKKLVNKSQSIKQEIKDLHITLLKIQAARKGINELIKIIKNNLAIEIEGYDLYFLCNLFYSKIEVSNDSLIYYVTFSEYFESGDCNEFQA